MPKYNREMEEKIVKLFEQGKRNSVISRELSIDRGTLPSRRKAWEKRKQENEKPETEPEKVKQVDASSSLELMAPNASAQLSKDVIQCLYNMQGIMGASSINGAIKQAYQNEVSTAKFRVTHWPTYSDAGEEFTTEAMIEKLLDYIDYQESEMREWVNSYSENVIEIKNLKEFAEERYEEGLEQGRREHAIYAPCVYCGKPYQVKPLSKTHGVITQALAELGWGHASCARKDEYNRGAGSRALKAEMIR